MTPIAGKCKHLKFRGSSELFMGLHVVEQVPDNVDLGVVIDKDLNWMGHVSEKCHKACGLLAMMKRNSPKCKLEIYESLILPIIVYA